MPSYSVLKNTVCFAFSVSLSRIIGIGSNFFCIILLAQLGTDHLAASSLITSVQYLIISTTSAMLYSVGSLLGNAYGAQNNKKMHSILKNGMLFAVLLSIPAITIVLLSGPILKILGQPIELITIVQSYFDNYCWGIPAILLLGVGQQVIFGISKTLPVNIISFFNGALTICLGYLFIFGKLSAPALGAAGLGQATAIAAWLSFIGFLLYLKYTTFFKDLFVDFSMWLDRNVFKELLKIGIPIGIQIGSELLTLIALTTLIGSFIGKEALSIHQIATQYLLLTIIPIFSINQACSILVSQASGKNNFFEATKMGNLCIALGIGISFLVLILFYISPIALMAPFLEIEDPQNKKLLTLGSTLLIINGIGQIFDAIRIISAGALQGAIKNTAFAMKIGIISMCVITIPLAYVLGVLTHLGVIGVYIARTLGMILGGTVLFYYWHQHSKQLLNSS